MVVIAECRPSCPCKHIPVWREKFEDYDKGKQAAIDHVGDASIREVSRDVAEQLEFRHD